MKNKPISFFLIVALAFIHEANTGKIVGTLESSNGPMDEADGLMYAANGPMDRELVASTGKIVGTLESSNGPMESEDKAMPIPDDPANEPKDRELESEDGPMPIDPVIEPMDRQLDTEEPLPDIDDEEMEAVNGTMDREQEGACSADASALMAGGDIGSALVGVIAPALDLVPSVGAGLEMMVTVFDAFSSSFASHKDEFCNDDDLEEIKTEIGKVQEKLTELDKTVQQGFQNLESTLIGFEVNTKIHNSIMAIKRIKTNCYDTFCHSTICSPKKLGAIIDKSSDLYEQHFLDLEECVMNAPNNLAVALSDLNEFIKEGAGRSSLASGYSIYDKEHKNQKHYCKPEIRDFYNSLFVEGTYFLLLVDGLKEESDYKENYQSKLKQYIMKNMDLFWKHCTNAQCTHHSYYGLTSTNSENCCDIKQDSTTGVSEKCGQLEGPCYNQNDCLDGYTCSQYVNSKCWNLAKNRIVQVFPNWGDLYKVEFDITVTNVNVAPEGGWINVLHFTADGNVANKGDRIPAVWINAASSYFHICSTVNGDQHNCYNHNFDLNTKYNIKIEQTSAHYNVYINGVSEHKILNSVVPPSYRNVKLYASDPWHASFSGVGSICNVKIYSDIYGNENVPAIVQPQDSCIEEDTDFLGYSIDFRANVANPTACRTLCQSNSNCKFWTYGLTAHSGKCWLKSEDTGRVPYSGLISGRKKCDLCLEKDTDFLGNSIDFRANVANPTACRTLCESNSNCKVWTYGLTAHSGGCWLKSTDSGRQSYPGLISGRTNCNTNMCSICPSGTYRVGNECRSCDCKEKGTESCNPSTGACICNNKAISGSQDKCEIYSCYYDSDCSEGKCWMPGNANIYEIFDTTAGTYNTFPRKLELTITAGSAPAVKYGYLAGIYLLGPGVVNKQHWYKGVYWISANGKYAIWHCKDCAHIEFLIGDLSSLGGTHGSGKISGWDGKYMMGKVTWYLNTMNDWRYGLNGEWEESDAISFTNHENSLIESEKGRCVACASCTFTGGCTGCNDQNSGWLPLQ